MKKLVIASALIAALSGCQSTSSVGNDLAQMACYFPYAPEHEAPQWVCDNMPNGVKAGSVGYSEESAAGLRLMRKIAITEARRGVAESFESDVKVELEAKMARIRDSSDEGTSEKVKEFIDDVAKSMSSITLTDSRVMASVRSPAGGLYVLVGMDDTAYQENKRRAEAASKANHPELWTKMQKIESTK